jgi:hypothetical protein
MSCFKLVSTFNGGSFCRRHELGFEFIAGNRLSVIRERTFLVGIMSFSFCVIGSLEPV